VVRPQLADPSTGEARFGSTAPDEALIELEEASRAAFAAADDKAVVQHDFIACAATDADRALIELRTGKSLVGYPSFEWCAHAGPGDFYPFDQVGRERATERPAKSPMWDLRSAKLGERTPPLFGPASERNVADGLAPERPMRVQQPAYAMTSAANQQNLGRHNVKLRQSEMPAWRQQLDGPEATRGSGGDATWIARESGTTWKRQGDERLAGRLLDRTDPMYGPEDWSPKNVILRSETFHQASSHTL